MQLHRPATSPTNLAPEATFTGDVWISDYFRRPTPSRLAGASVTFPPGARTPWKRNPQGQTLIVTSGAGWAQGEGEAIVEIRAGDLVWFPPEQRHWEGATPDESMTYVAIQEEGDGMVQFPREGDGRRVWGGTGVDVTSTRRRFRRVDPRRQRRRQRTAPWGR